MIPVADLFANPWNPNTMSDAALAEYVAEVRHLGALLSPPFAARSATSFRLLTANTVVWPLKRSACRACPAW